MIRCRLFGRVMFGIWCGLWCVATALAEGVPIVNAVCPVMGNPVGNDTPYTVTYKGEKIGFCHQECITQFQANPKRYMKKIAKEKKERARAARSAKNTKSQAGACAINCPHCTVPLDFSDDCKDAREKGRYEKLPSSEDRPARE